MFDPRIEKLAAILVNYSVHIQPGDWVLLMAHTETLPYLHAVAEQVLKAGGHFDVKIQTDDLTELTLKHASPEQLGWISPADHTLYEGVDAIIYLRGASNTRALSNADPRQQQRWSKSRGALDEIRFKRTGEGDLRWVVSYPPCTAYAQDADMSLRDYEDFVFGATYATSDDPVAEWQRIHDEQQRLVDYLADKRQITLQGPNIDLSLSVEGRRFLNADGTFNMPDGEIFTGPVEESVNGWVKFTYPAVRGGREVEGVEFRFEEGKVVQASASKNEAYLISQLDTDPGARYLGEFAIGTNYNIQQFTRNILYDEKIGGTIHMAVGASYPQTGGQNKSNIHWDFICDMRQDSEIRADGELFYQNGQFTI